MTITPAALPTAKLIQLVLLLDDAAAHFRARPDLVSQIRHCRETIAADLRPQLDADSAKLDAEIAAMVRD